jgi:two-component system alkaline phosphatase synthesis response regulator PhoP
MSKKVLIVDDESHIRTLLLQMLEGFVKSGIELRVASEGTEAWRIAQSEKPDLIILDIMMPGLSGYEVCRRVKADPALADTHVLILTAKGQAVDHQQSLEAGADEYITKPFDIGDLVRYVARVLDVPVPEQFLV